MTSSQLAAPTLGAVDAPVVVISPPVLSRYERRVDLVRAVLAERTKLKTAAATALAVEILSVIDHIPERVR